MTNKSWGQRQGGLVGLGLVRSWEQKGPGQRRRSLPCMRPASTVAMGDRVLFLPPLSPSTLWITFFFKFPSLSQ
jgi:hypothetical protein